MIPTKTEKIRQALINEIVATLEFLDYLNFEAKVPVHSLIKTQENKKRLLVGRLRTIE